MAFSVDATSHATAQNGGASLAWNHTNGASANKLVVTVGTGGSTTNERNISTVTYNGVACTQLGEIDDTIFEHSEIWRLNSPATGSALQVLVTPVATIGVNGQFTGGAVSFNEAESTDGTASTNTATSTNPTVTVADSANGDIVVSLVSSDVGPDNTTNENGTLIWEDEDVNADSDFNAQRQVATGANTVCAWTSGSSSNWAAIGVAIKAAEAASAARGLPANRIYYTKPYGAGGLRE